MENATKALMMGVGMLIGVMLLSFLVYMFKFMSYYSGTVQSNLDAKELYEFNAKFEEYQRSDLIAQDVKSILNLVKDYNANFETGESDTQAIKVVWGGGINSNAIETDLINNAFTYSCTLEYNMEKVSRVRISRN